MKVIKAPGSLEEFDVMDNVVFLAGSIEMGKAEDWQSKVTNALKDMPNLMILNPRRDDWDSSWEQSIHNAQFREQVEWELEALEAATHIIIYFQPGTMSPISLLELGLFISSNLYVCCPPGFWRKGNVDIVVEKYAINRMVYEDLDILLVALKEDLV